MDKRKVRWALACSWVLLAVTTCLFVYRGPFRAARKGAPDYALYYASTRAWLQGKDCWSPCVLAEVTAGQDLPRGLFSNALAPPMTYLPLAPLALLEYRLSLAIWTVLNCALVGAMIKMLATLAGLPLSPRCPRCVLMTALILGLAPLQTCIGFGQLAVAAVAMSVFALYALHRGRPRVAGLCFAVSALLKPQLALGLVLFWIALRAWRVLIPAGIALTAATALACGRLWLSMGHWVSSYRAQSARMLDGGYGDYARAGSGYIWAQLQFPLYRIFGSKVWASGVAWAIAGALLVWLVWILWRRAKAQSPEGRDYRLLLLSVLAVWQLLPIYHVYYDAAIVAVAIAWAASQWFVGPLRTWGKTILILSAGLLLPLAPAMNYAAKRGWLGSLPGTWLYRCVLIAYLPWLLLGMTAVLLWALHLHGAKAESAGQEG